MVNHVQIIFVNGLLTAWGSEKSGKSVSVREHMIDSKDSTPLSKRTIQGCPLRILTYLKKDDFQQSRYCSAWLKLKLNTKMEFKHHHHQ